jgi:hypothetical protein
MYCIVIMRIVDVKVLFRYLIYTILTIFAYIYKGVDVVEWSRALDVG